MAKEYVPRAAECGVEAFLNNGLVKLITGPRRAGKSVFALRMLQGKNFAYLNFDDNNLVESFDEIRISDALDAVYPGYAYLVLDEIQNLPEWNDWVGKLYRAGINTIITGSNSNLLSGEMESMLTGRYISREIFPFCFSEFCRAKKIPAPAFECAEEYLSNGGYPEIVNNRDIQDNYLETLFDSILAKDIARRHGVRHLSELNNLAEFLVSSFSTEVTYNSLMKDLGMRSENTVKKFVGYFQEAYLFYLLPRFNNKLKLMQKAPRKVYVIDNGLISAKSFEVGANSGRRLENLVFLELVRRGFVPGRSLFYYHTAAGDKEIDFVCRTKNRVSEIIQVCYRMDSSRTCSREFDAIEKASVELECPKRTVVVWNGGAVPVHPDGIEIVRYSDWAQ